MLLLGELPPKIFDEGSHAGVAGKALASRSAYSSAVAISPASRAKLISAKRVRRLLGCRTSISFKSSIASPPRPAELSATT